MLLMLVSILWSMVSKSLVSWVAWLICMSVIARSWDRTESLRSWNAARRSSISWLSDCAAVGGATSDGVDGGAIGVVWLAADDQGMGLGGRRVRCPVPPRPLPCLLGVRFDVFAIGSGAAENSRCWATRSAPPGMRISSFIVMLLPAAEKGPRARRHSSARLRGKTLCGPRSRMVEVGCLVLR